MPLIAETAFTQSSTASGIIDRAYSLIGIKAASDPLSAADAEYGLNVLNSLVDSWNTQSLFILATTEVVATVSTASATIGPGMLFDCARPTTIHNGAFSRVNGVDYPIAIIDAEQYASIPNKAMTSTFPDYVYYEPTAGSGTVYFFPVPTGAEVHLPINAFLTAFADLSTVYYLAPGYQRAFEYSLAEELAPGIRPLDPNIIRFAQNARRVIRRSNVTVPILGCDLPVGPFTFYRGA